MTDDNAEKAWEEHTLDWDEQDYRDADPKHEFMAGRESRNAEVAAYQSQLGKSFDDNDELREQLAEARAEIERRPEPAFRDALIADRNKAESALAEAQATIERVIALSKNDDAAMDAWWRACEDGWAVPEWLPAKFLRQILSAPSSTGGATAVVTAPWDDPTGCFGHCDPEGWFAPCRNPSDSEKGNDHE